MTFVRECIIKCSDQLTSCKKCHPSRRITDVDLLNDLLSVGEIERLLFGKNNQLHLATE